jgi:glycosyltransferase involved in cell wall biosynthesis
MQSGGCRTKGIQKFSRADKPLISVITVVYNAIKNGKKLDDAIESVLHQTYDNVEYIIIDGASTDGTIDIIKKYEDTIDYWISEPDGGMHDAFNKGIDLATGDVIVLLNSDDFFDDQTCQIVSQKMLESEADIYFGMARVIDENKVTQYICGYTDKTLNKYMIPHSACFIKTAVYTIFKYDTHLRTCGDHDILLRLKKNNCTFLFIESILVNFTLGGVSETLGSRRDSNEVLWKHGCISPLRYFTKKMYLSKIFQFFFERLVREPTGFSNKSNL